MLPAGVRTRVARSRPRPARWAAAFSPLSVAVGLEDDIDVGARRPDRRRRRGAAPRRASSTATLCWLGDAPARPGGRYLLGTATTRTVRARLDEITHRIDVATLGRESATELALNDLGEVRLRLGEPVMADAYADVRSTGAFILIDAATNETVGAGMIS